MEATHDLELNIEKLSWEADRTKCQHPHSCSHSWGRLQERPAQSPSPHRPRRHVIFCEPEEGTSSDERPQREPKGQVTRGEVEESDLDPPPTLRLELECFLEMPTTGQGARDRWSFPPEPSIRDYDKWLEWWANQLHTLHWWEELTTIPGMEDVKKLAQKIHASFEVPAVRGEALRGQVFTAPPAAECINRNMFLPDGLPYQDIQLKPHWMTLAYAQALQYLAEEANPPAPGEPCPLVMSIFELRQHMGKHTKFHNCNVSKALANALSRATGEDTQPSPLGNSLVDDLTASSFTSEAEVEEDAQPGPVGMPLMDPTISSDLSEVENTQPSPVGTPPADDPTIPSAIPETEVREDLSAVWSTSPVKLRRIQLP